MAPAPDFGRQLVSQGWPKDGVFTFLPFELHNIVRLDTGSYSTMSNMDYGGRSYAVSLDFDEAKFEEILKCLPQGVADEVRRHFQREIGPSAIQFPTPFRIAISARLGEEVTNEMETYIPMVVTEMTRYVASSPKK